MASVEVRWGVVSLFLCHGLITRQARWRNVTAAATRLAVAERNEARGEIQEFQVKERMNKINTEDGKKERNKQKGLFRDL